MHTPTRPPLASLETVCLVASVGSFSAAADASGVTHGAISRRISAVENWLGVALFERHGRGVRLTPDGQRFVGRIEHAFQVIDEAADQWRASRTTRAVKISIVPAFAKLWLFDRLAALEGGTPPLQVQIQIENRTVDVAAGEADIAIRYGRGAWPNLDAERLITETLYPVAHPTLAARVKGGGIDALLAQPLLHDSDLTGWRAWFAARGVALKPRVQDRRFEDYTLVLAAAEAGLGIALARAPIVDAWLAQSPLVRVSRFSVTCPLAYHLVTARHERRAEVLALVERLRDAARPHRARG